MPCVSTWVPVQPVLASIPKRAAVSSAFAHIGVTDKDPSENVWLYGTLSTPVLVKFNPTSFGCGV